MIASTIFYDGGSQAVEEKLLELIENHNIGTVFLDTEFFPIVDCIMISRIPDGVLRVLLAFDDALQHEFNLQNALSCHAVLTADPISVRLFQQRSIPAHFICLEGSPSLYYPASEGEKPVHDVLFFGDPTRGDRPKWLSYLVESGIEVTIPSYGSLSYEELAKQIRSSRIVLNFSKVAAAPYSPLASKAIAPYLYFKGRIIEAGLSKTLCLSEEFPGVEDLFGEGTLQCFSSPEECLKMIKKFLADEENRLLFSKALYDICTERYADPPQSKAIANFLFKLPAISLTESGTDITYCANLLSRKIFKLLPNSPLLTSREIFRLISNRLLGGMFFKNLITITFITIFSIISIFFYAITSRYSAPIQRLRKPTPR